MKKARVLICLLAIVSLIITPLTVSASLPIATTTTLYIDTAKIGEADSFLISKNKQFMMVDTGKADYVKDDANKTVTYKEKDWPWVKNILDSRGVTNLKALVITHYDIDHVGNFLNVIDYIKQKNGIIEHIYARKYTSAQLNTLTEVRRTNYVMFVNGILKYLNRSSEQFNLYSYDTVAVAEKTNSLFGSGNGLWIFPTRTNTIADFTLDGNTTVKWLNKWESYVVPGMDSSSVDDAVNNDSLTFTLKFDKNQTGNAQSMLFTGDISWTPQAELVTNCPAYIKNTGILKVPHHGIPNYQNKTFINFVAPSYSFVTTASSYNRIPSMKDYGKFGNIYYSNTASAVTDYCTIAIRIKAPSLVFDDTSLCFHSVDTDPN